MQELIDRLVKEANVTPEQAKQSIETIAAFHVSTLNAKFLNPKTRNSALDYYYILQKK